MKLLSNAIVFKAELPCVELLENHLRDFKHTEILPSSQQSFGFVENKVTGEWVTAIDGGLAIQIQLDNKIMPADVIKNKVDERIEVIKSESGRDSITKKEKQHLTIEVVSLMLPNAMVRSKVITAFYDTKSGFLIVDTTRKAISDLFITLLVKACGSVRAETINIRDVKLDVTTKLIRHLICSDSFNGFGVGNYCKLINQETGEKKTYDGADFECEPDNVLQDFYSGFSVSDIQLSRRGLKFKVTSNFEFKQFKFEEVEDEDHGDDKPFAWRHESSVKMLQVVDVINSMCELVGYGEDK